MILIGLTGPPGAGKKTIAEYLVKQRHFERVFFFINIGHARRTTPLSGIVFDDLRFDYEAESIRSVGGQIWHLQRPGFLRRDGDPDKGVMPLVMPVAADRGILNDSTIEALHTRVDELLASLRGMREAKT